MYYDLFDDYQIKLKQFTVKRHISFIFFHFTLLYQKKDHKSPLKFDIF